jgi:hypothetical protein
VNVRSEEIVQTEVIDRIEVPDRIEVIGVIARTELVVQIEVIVQTEVIMADRDKGDVRGGRINAAIGANTRNARKPRRSFCLKYRSHLLRLRKWCRQ